jgi:antirestriction protein ArdC
MTQADRDRLVTLKKAKKKLITQREAAEELGLSVRHIFSAATHAQRAADYLQGLQPKPESLPA